MQQALALTFLEVDAAAGCGGIAGDAKEFGGAVAICRQTSLDSAAWAC
jgi:hypothetical protein